MQNTQINAAHNLCRTQQYALRSGGATNPPLLDYQVPDHMIYTQIPHTDT